MNDIFVRSTLLHHPPADRASGEFQSEVYDEGELASEPAKLTTHDIRRLYAAMPSPQARALTVEIYRLRGLIGRAALYLRMAKERGMEQSLDITSRNLLRTLSQALEREPAVMEQTAGLAAIQPLAHRWEMSAPRTAAEKPVAREVKVIPQPPELPAQSEARYRQRLFTWKLLPQPGRGGDAWKGGAYRGMVIVRAHDPLQARKLAAEKLAAPPPPAKSGSRIGTSPWYRRSLVRVELVSEDSTYDRIDRPSVVYP
jgi:hypothetical protein